MQKNDIKKAATILQDESLRSSEVDKLCLESRYDLAIGDTLAAINKLVDVLARDNRPILGQLIEPKYDLAQLMLSVGDYDNATEYCKQALQTKRVLMFAQTPIFFSKSIALLAEIYERHGKTDDAIAECERFLHYWKNADTGIPLLLEVRERLHRLQQAQHTS